MADMKNNSRGEADSSPTYLENDMPKLFKLFLYGIILWGVIFALYFILTGYNSEKKFDAGGGHSSVRSLTVKSGPPLNG